MINAFHGHSLVMKFRVSPILARIIVPRDIDSYCLECAVVVRDQDNAKKLVNGQIDLWATGDPAGRCLARQDGVTGLKTVLR
jgi:hypothetical protein